MQWHTFEKDQKCGLDVVSAKIQKRINEGGFKNSKAALLRLEDIDVADTKCGLETRI
jgi:hypothetical protein